MQPEHSDSGDPEWNRLLQIHQMNQTAVGFIGGVTPSASDLEPVDDPAKKRQRIETVSGISQLSMSFSI